MRHAMGSGRSATSAQLVSPNNIAIDGQGNIFFSASGLSMVLKVATNGVISVVAGTGLSSGGGDGGLAVGASLDYPAEGQCDKIRSDSARVPPRHTSSKDKGADGVDSPLSVLRGVWPEQERRK